MSSGSQQGAYNSRRMKKRQQFKAEEAVYHAKICVLVNKAKYVELVLGLIAAIGNTWWAIIPFAALFLVLHLFSEEDLKKVGWRRYVKLGAFVVFCAIQIVFLVVYILVNVWTMLIVNGVQITILVFLRKRVNDYRAFMDRYGEKKDDPVSSAEAKKFFNAELIKNLGSIQSQCDKKTKEAITKKYSAKYSGKDMPFEVGKAILKEVNENNDMNQLQDMSGQSIKNAKYLVEE